MGACQNTRLLVGTPGASAVASSHRTGPTVVYVERLASLHVTRHLYCCCRCCCCCAAGSDGCGYDSVYYWPCSMFFSHLVRVVTVTEFVLELCVANPHAVQTSDPMNLK